MSKPLDEDEQLAEVLREYVEDQDLADTKDRLAEIAALAEINEIAAGLLAIGKRLSGESSFSDPVFRSDTLAVLLRARDSAVSLHLFISKLGRKKSGILRRSSIPPAIRRRR